jgi:uncharacterized Zn finger protein
MSVQCPRCGCTTCLQDVPGDQRFDNMYLCERCGLVFRAVMVNGEMMYSW